MTENLGWVGLLRHGQSRGNVASAEAERAGHDVIDLRERDADVALTTHVHAVAGQRLIPRTGATGLLARELVEQVPQVIAELSR